MPVERNRPDWKPRAVLTAGWYLAAAGFLRWWEATLRLPAVLIWTLVFGGLFLLTAYFLAGAAVFTRRHAVVRRAGAWGVFVVVALLGVGLFPQIHVGGVPVQTVAFAGMLDVVLPGWILISALTMLWEGPARWGVLAAVPLLLLVGVWTVVIRMPGTSFDGPLDPLTDDQLARRATLRAHVARLASDIGERHEARYPALQTTAQYLDSVLTATGYDVQRDAFEYGGRTFHNLVVEIPGSTQPDDLVIVGAHYDTAEGAPGADDNASGVAGVLELARQFRDDPQERTLRFVLFPNEEPPFFNTEWMGSAVYAGRVAQRGERVTAMISLETIGYYSDEAGSQRYPPPFNFFYPHRGDFVGFVGNLGSHRLVRSALDTFRREARFPSEGVASPSWIPGITWSDHASFWARGYPAIMITDTAPFRNPYYHTSLDTVDRLDFDRMTRVVDGIGAVVRHLGATS